MWNYPDGMKESDIPGWNDWETTVNVQCGTHDVEIDFVSIEDVEVFVNSIINTVNSKFIEDIESRLSMILKTCIKFKAIINENYTAVVDMCPFNGLVEAIGSGNTIYWNCPVCKTDHDYDLKP